MSGQQSNLSTSSISSSNSSSSHSPPNSCPVCGIQLSPNELDSHFLTELDRLYKLTTPAERQRLRASLSNLSGPNSLQNGGHPELGLHLSNGGPGSRWETFNRIRANRQNRLRAKTRKRKGDSESDYPSPNGIGQCQSCPVCHGRLQRTAEEITQHIEDCIKKSGQNFPLLNHHPNAGGTNNNGSNPNSSSNSSGSHNNQDEDETVDVESYGDDASVNSGTSQNLSNHPLNPHSNSHCHPSSSLSLKLIEHQTIPSITNPNHPHHSIHSPMHHHHHLHHPGHNHILNHSHHQHQHHNPYNGHPLHHLSMAQPPHLSSSNQQPQQTTPLSLSMNSEQNPTNNTNSPITASSDEVSSISSWDKKQHKLGPTTTLPSPAVSRVTPTSTNHKMDVDYDEIHTKSDVPSITTSTTTTTTTTSVNARIAIRSSSHSENEEDLVVDTIEDDEDMEDKNNNNIIKSKAELKTRQSDNRDEEKIERKR